MKSASFENTTGNSKNQSWNLTSLPTERTQRRLSKVAKPVDKRLYKNYLQKSEEMLDVARYAEDTPKNIAAVASSVHCAINAIDALSVCYFGMRHGGGHVEALVVLTGAFVVNEFSG